MVIFSNDCNITSLTEPVVIGSKSIVNDSDSCGTVQMDYYHLVLAFHL